MVQGPRRQSASETAKGSLDWRWESSFHLVPGLRSARLQGAEERPGSLLAREPERQLNRQRERVTERPWQESRYGVLESVRGYTPARGKPTSQTAFLFETFLQTFDLLIQLFVFLFFSSRFHSVPAYEGGKVGTDVQLQITRFFRALFPEG